MGEGYSKIFWGLFLTMFHINLGSIQLLPNFIGLLIVLNGIKQMLYKYENIKELKNAVAFCYMSIIIEFIIFFIKLISYEGIALIFNLIIIELGIISDFIMIFYILSGAVRILERLELTIAANEYIKNIRIFTVLYSILCIILAISVSFNFEIIAVLSIIFWIIINIWLLIIIRGLKNLKIDDEVNYTI
ncbi:hypothetical protein [Anaerovorax odorimutans]|uniref:hypothetical protein n=1 Tax=Anaerovorax odorimutans TaxID=109327 RepID=UPI0004182282|nr:hypothetical protein [Anaerovorax odorimutans]